jgi:hypothetical protein
MARISSDDLIVWPDGGWCFRDELLSFGLRSDVYEVVSVNAPEWDARVISLQGEL